MVNTTLNIKLSLLEMVNNAASICKISRSHFIILLLQRIMKENKKLFGSYSQIKYQKSDAEDSWHNFHICFSTYQYEYCLDMRKFFKMSVSFILAYAIENYLDEIIELLKCGKNKTNTDNYLYKNYILINNNQKN